MLLKPPKVTMRPTLPFDEGEMTRILAAADALATWGSFVTTAMSGKQLSPSTAF